MRLWLRAADGACLLQGCWAREAQPSMRATGAFMPAASHTIRRPLVRLTVLLLPLSTSRPSGV